MLAATETVRVEVAEILVGDKIMLLGLASALIPDGPDTDIETVPEKPFKPLTVIVEVTEDPARIEIDVLVATLKSTTLTATTTEWVSEPLVPVTVTE